MKDGRAGVLTGLADTRRAGFLVCPLPSLPDCFAVRLRLLTHSEQGLRGLSAGISHGSPVETTNRLFQVALQSTGTVSVFGGTRWWSLSSYPRGRWVSLQLVCDQPSQTLDVLLDGHRLNRSPLNLWNSATPDTLFLNDYAPAGGGAAIAVDDITVSDAEVLSPPRRLRVELPGQGTVALHWHTPQANQAAGTRVYRDGTLVCTVATGRGWFVDRGLKPGSWYVYSLSTLLKDGRESMRTWPLPVLTRPRTERRPGTRARFDVVVFGGTPSGIAAAVTAARAGKRVALVAPSRWLGGMMTGGLSRTDFGRKEACGGLFRLFLDQVLDHYRIVYGDRSPQVQACREGFYFEPKLARTIFTRWLDSCPTLHVYRQHLLRGVSLDGNRLTGLLVFDAQKRLRRRLAAKVFVDATYEGDLAAFAGARYRIGRESRSDYGESLAGELYWDVWKRKIVGGSGAGDAKVQAYNYRLCLTPYPENRLAPPPPETYPRQRYAGLLPDLHDGKLKTLKDVLSILPLPNAKYDANNHPQGNPSSDFIGGNPRYPDATTVVALPADETRGANGVQYRAFRNGYPERVRIAEAHRNHVLGLLYFLRFDPAVPEAFRKGARRWGFARDEFADNGNFPTQLYVREARRIVGEYLFTQHDAQPAPGKQRPPLHRDSIAVGAYSLDSHATTAPSSNHPYLLEGFFYVKAAPYQIPYRCLLPKGVDGLLVSCCVSATHIGYGTLRMEPVFMALGQAAGAASALSVDSRRSPRTIDIDRLQRNLVEDHQVITFFSDVDFAAPHFAALQYFGTWGFFPSYKARPLQPVSRGVAAQWTWQWLRHRRPTLPTLSPVTPHYRDVPRSAPAYTAIESLRRFGICPARTFRPEAPLRATELRRWFQLLHLQSAPFSSEPATVSRGQLCQLLYEH